MIEVTDDMLSGFDSSAAGEVTVTITYDKKTVDFTVTVLESESGDEPENKSCSTVAPLIRGILSEAAGHCCWLPAYCLSVNVNGTTSLKKLKKPFLLTEERLFVLYADSAESENIGS